MLKKVLKLEYKLELQTGTHIGGATDTFDIGGADSTVIKNPLNKEPYIPGSSIKGKIKSLLLYRYGVINNKKLVFPLSKETMKNIFETSDEAEVKISRAIFRDAVLDSESKEKLEKELGKGVYTEIKAENSIDPLAGKAANPRFIERVPAGVVFDGEINLMIFDGDDEETMKKAILEGIEYLELNYLGGSGSRGYGKVTIRHNGFKEEVR